MRHAAIAIEGVLRDPVNGRPSEGGRSLYLAMNAVYRVTLLADDDHAIEQWLKIEGYDEHTGLLYAPGTMTRYLQIKSLRAQGPLDLAITAEPELAHQLFALGQPHLLHINPRQYTSLPPRDEWDELVARIDEDRARAANVMLSADEEDEEE